MQIHLTWGKIPFASLKTIQHLQIEHFKRVVMPVHVEFSIKGSLLVLSQLHVYYI